MFIKNGMGWLTGFENVYRKDVMKPNISCDFCTSEFYKRPCHIKRSKNNFCSLECVYQFNRKSIQIYCKQCNKDIIIKPYQLQGDKERKFCNSVCAGKYNSKHKKIGTKRSKLEFWIESELTNHYPSLEVCYNKKDVIGSELDIYIPSLKLAIELNGIFHYEPIYGQKKLELINKKDANKFYECQKVNISLCVIDVSDQKYFKVSTSIKYLNIIKTLIDELLLI
jgi:hypothetical protein